MPRSLLYTKALCRCPEIKINRPPLLDTILWHSPGSLWGHTPATFPTTRGIETMNSRLRLGLREG